MNRVKKGLSRRVSAERVNEPPPGLPAGFQGNHFRTTSAGMGGGNPMHQHSSAPGQQQAQQAQPSARPSRPVRRSSDTAIRDPHKQFGIGDMEAQRQALEFLKQAGPVSSGGSSSSQTLDDGMAAARSGHVQATPPRKRGAVRRNTEGAMDLDEAPAYGGGAVARHGGSAPLPEGMPPARTYTAPAPQAAKPEKRPMRRGSTEGNIQFGGAKPKSTPKGERPSRGSFIFDLPGEGAKAAAPLGDDSPKDDYDGFSLRSGMDVDADLDLAYDRLPPGVFTGSREVTEVDMEQAQAAAAAMSGSKSAPVGGSDDMVMRSATEVNSAVARARERLPSDEWSDEARRTTHEVLVTFEALVKGDGEGGGDDDGGGLTVWQAPDDSGGAAGGGGGGGGGNGSSTPRRLELETTTSDAAANRPRVNSNSPSSSPGRGGTTPGRSRKKTVWAPADGGLGSARSTDDETDQSHWSDTDSDHEDDDGDYRAFSSSPHGNGSRGRGGSGSDGPPSDGAQRIGGGSSDGEDMMNSLVSPGAGAKSAADAMAAAAALAPASGGFGSVGSEGSAASGSTAGTEGDSMGLRSLEPSPAPAPAGGMSRISFEEEPAMVMEPAREPEPALEPAGGGLRPAAGGGGGGGVVGGGGPMGGGDPTDPMMQMTQMLSERATKLEKEKRILTERVEELEHEKEEWEALKAKLIGALAE